MRLYNIVFVCRAYRKGLNASIKENSNGTFTIENWPEVRKTIFGLRQIKCLKEYSEKAYYSLPQVEREKSDRAIAASSQFKNEFLHSLDILKTAAEIIIKLYDSLEVGEASSGLDIRIPQCSSLADHISILKDIDFILTQCPYVTKSDERISFKSIDIGSQWLTFMIDGTVAAGFGWALLQMIASLVNKAIELRSRLTMCKMQELFYEEEKERRKISQDTIKDLRKYRKAILDEAVKEIEGEYGVLSDGEEQGKMEACLEKMAMLIDKGVEVYASIDTPRDMRALFPMAENNAILPDNLLKMIEKKD